jgi:amino acid adenylation domain-containing protein
MARALPELVAAAAERHAAETALVLGPERMSFAELEQESDRVAAQLVAHGCERGDRICLFLPKSPATTAAMLGVLKAGCAYVPIDLSSPAARLAKVVSSTEPALVLAVAGAAPLLEEIRHEGVLDPAIPVGTTEREPLPGELVTAFTAQDTSQLDARRNGRDSRPDDIAHILFTSGSTGTPKGVMITHANVVAFLEWAIGYFGIAPRDRTSGHPPLHFDLSTFDVYGSLAAGAELHLVPPQLNVTPHGLARFIAEAELTQWFSVPSAMTYMARHDAVPDDGFPSLQRVLWCGEVLPTPVLVHWMRRIPQARFTNLYGPTEATIASSYYTVPELPVDETVPVPIGSACAGEELLVLDERMRPVIPGEIGDLYIAGVGLSPGYWQDHERTRAVFVDDPRGGGRVYRTGDLARVEDGVVWFLGRADTQIKSRGYRIELGEIETALNALPGVGECAVVGVETEGFEGVSICGALAPAEGGQVDPVGIRDELRRALPPYMLPTRWLVLAQLPKNANGKIDRPAVGRLFEEGADAEGRPAKTATPGRGQ